MIRSFRRYEMLLPRKFNDNTLVPLEFLADTVLELRQQFGAVSSETQTIQGIWRHEGVDYSDELVRVFVDVPDTPENHAFMVQFKETLKSRFQQIDIWMTTHPLDVI